MVDSPQPTNLSYMWNFGSLLGACLIIQIVTGITLAMHYTPNIDLAFISVEHIMRDVNYGWLIRYLHANVASFFFIFVYLHISRGLYYGSYRAPRTLAWSVGVVIFILMIATAFLGYVLPYGQMSLWGATVITNLLSAIPWIGQDFVQFVWGGFSVNNATLNRFFSLHYLLPFILAALAAVHLIAVHEHGFFMLGPKLLYIKSTNIILSTLSFIIPNTRANKRIGPHSEDIISLLVGGLLGDIGAERNMNGGVRFRFRQSVIHKEYLFFLYNFLLTRGYCNNNLPLLKNYKNFNYYAFDTYSFTSLMWLYKSFYNNKIKIVPLNIIELLTPLALAIWIMDDGGAPLRSKGLRLHTHNFTEKEVDLLINALTIKFNLKCSKQKNNNKFIIYISSKSMNILRELVLPHMHNSMLYKINL